jgi:hypothetical protein
VLAAEDMLVVNDSASGRVLGVDGETGAIVHAVQLPGELPFPRGLVALGDGRFLVGTQWPVALHVVDLPSERIVQRMPLSDDRNESAYAIAPVPAAFRDPAQLPQTRAGWEIPGADASARADVRVPLPTS